LKKTNAEENARSNRKNQDSFGPAATNADKGRIVQQVADLKGQIDGGTPTGGGAGTLGDAAIRIHVVNRLDQILRGM